MWDRRTSDGVPDVLRGVPYHFTTLTFIEISLSPYGGVKKHISTRGASSDQRGPECEIKVGNSFTAPSPAALEPVRSARSLPAWTVPFFQVGRIPETFNVQRDAAAAKPDCDAGVDCEGSNLESA